MIAFRVDTQCGLGHLMRMKWLALELEKRQEHTLFFVDQSEVVEPFLVELNAICVTVPPFNNCEDDARFCLNYLKALEQPIKWLVLDGYNFGLKWERAAKQSGMKLLAIDDLVREHCADAVVDMKWAGNTTQNRYDALTPPDTDLMLGPQFAILSPEYDQSEYAVSRDECITFSLGGGGDWRALEKIIEQLCLTLPEVKLIAVVGPKATNTHELEVLSKQFKQLELIHSPKSLAQYYRSTGLFVGALGTSLYELAATQTPALTFSLAANQENNIEDLEQLGHFHHVEALLTYSAEKVARLITTLYEHRDRQTQLRSSPPIDVDGKGACRIADYITQGMCADPLILSGSVKVLPEVVSKISSSLQVRPITDGDMNGYLTARNRQENMWRMTITDTIKRIDHYTWWYNNQRHSYVLEEDNDPLVYVWHQVYRHNNKKYLFGGWFAASDKVSFVHAQLILKWQLAYCHDLHPDAVWVAVINKDNKFVNLLNQKEGFVALETDSEEYHVTQQLFSQASEEEFNYVAKFPAGGG